MWALLMISPKAMQDFGKEVNRHPVGTGPFTFVSWSADTLRVRKNPNYWKPGLPKVDTVTFRSSPENGARIAALQAGEAHFIYPLPPEMAQRLGATPTDPTTKEPVAGADTSVNHDIDAQLDAERRVHDRHNLI